MVTPLADPLAVHYNKIWDMTAASWYHRKQLNYIINNQPPASTIRWDSIYTPMASLSFRPSSLQTPNTCSLIHIRPHHPPHSKYNTTQRAAAMCPTPQILLLMYHVLIIVLAFCCYYIYYKFINQLSLTSPSL